MPFDRLVRHVDAWAGSRGRKDVIAQIGESVFVPRYIEVQAFLTPKEFRRLASKASAIVAHAGMGTIITALELAKPILVFPRLGSMAETRNDHQVATARRFADTGRVLAAFSEEELAHLLDRIESFKPSVALSPEASRELIQSLRGFVFEEQS